MRFVRRRASKSTLKLSMRCIFQGTVVFFFLLVICRPYPCHAWHTLQHADITLTAFEQLPAEIKQMFQPYIDDILWASMAPDIFIRDWENHEWNIHREPGDTTAAPTRIEALSQDILRDLRREPADIAAAAENIGLLSHYLADINQPLHTDDYADDNDWIHLQYEIDVNNHKLEFHYHPGGLRLRPDICQVAIDSARQANLYYQAIIDAYTEGDGYDRVRRLTSLNLQRAVSDIADVWITLWFEGTSATPSLALQTNQDRFRPGDIIRITLTGLSGSQGDLAADLYVVVADQDGGLWFMTSDGGFFPEVTPFQKSWTLSSFREQTLFSAPLATCNAEVNFTVYAFLVTPDADVSNPKSWLSNLSEVHFHTEPLPANLLAELNDEPYLFPASSPDSGEVVGLALQRWDFIFLGEKVDDPATPGDESLLNRLIPGKFRHAVIYLGRDSLGRPCGLEFGAIEPYLGVVRFPESESAYPGGTRLGLPVSIENIRAYRNRWAKRLKKEELEQLQAAGDRVFTQVALDLQTDIPYQMEFNWSGDFADRQIYLVDDGLENGASCTDYLLSLLEETAGVCIHGSRMAAPEVEDYFRSDSSGVLATVPDEWNPFPFPVTAADILDMGYHLNDPPPHIFPCDNSEEIGVPLPAKLVNSPQLVDIVPVPLSPVYDSWVLEQMEAKECCE